MRELIIYADESERRGKFFSNFFGGALVSSGELHHVVDGLVQAKQEANLGAEIKWTKVTRNYLEKYRSVMEVFFDFIAKGQIKLRIMFTANRHVPRNLTSQQREHEYYLLYYQFLKHAFGLQFAVPPHAHVRCRLYLDDLPDTREKSARFKGYLEALSQSREFRGRVSIDRNQIAEVKSHDHVILQCLDVVLGAMHFRLNDKHKEKLEGCRCRGKRTIAKEKLYRYINGRIRRIHPGFNVGISTGGAPADRWAHPYRHWLFVPSAHGYDTRFQKRQKNPVSAT